MAKSSSKMVLAGMAGLAVGLAAGVLVAPKKGSKTRKRLKKSFWEMKDIVQQDDFPDTLEKLKSIFTKTKEDNVENESLSTNKDQSIFKKPFTFHHSLFTNNYGTKKSF